MSEYVTCAKLSDALAAKQNALTNCAGAPLAGPVPTCTEMNAAIDAAETPDATTAAAAPSSAAAAAAAAAGAASLLSSIDTGNKP